MAPNPNPHKIMQKGSSLRKLKRSTNFPVIGSETIIATHKSANEKEKSALATWK